MLSDTLMLAWKKLWFSQKEDGHLICFFFNLLVTNLSGKWITLRQCMEYLHQLNRRHQEVWRSDAGACSCSPISTIPVSSREQTTFTFYTHSSKTEKNEKFASQYQKSLPCLSTEILEMLPDDGRREDVLDILRSFLCPCFYATGWRNCYSKLR